MGDAFSHNKRMMQGFNPFEALPTTTVVPNRSTNGEVDLSNILMQRIASGQTVSGPKPQMNMNTNSPTTCKLVGSAKLYRQIQTNNFGNSQPMVVYVGTLNEVAPRAQEFELKGKYNCILVEGQQTIDLSNQSNLKTAHLVCVSAPLAGTFFVLESDVSGRPSSNQTKVLLG